MYMCVRNIDVVSVPCEWSCIYMSVRNIDVVSVPCEWSCIYMSVRNIDVVSVPCEWSCIYMSVRISMLSLFLVSDHVYVCQEYRCCLCSL